MQITKFHNIVTSH